MDAPLGWSGNGRSPSCSTIPVADPIEGVARHVSAEGCQFLVISGVPEQGRAMTVTMDAGRSVSGTIRWVLSGRIGFAFDEPLGAEVLAELSGHLAQFKAVQLLPADLPGPRS